MKCIYKAYGNICLKHSTNEALEHCLDGTCPDEILRGDFVCGKLDLRDKARDWSQYVMTLEACYDACLRMVIEYQDDIIPGYRERAEKAEAQLSQYTASGLEPCDYTAMRSAIDGEKEARQSLSEALRALAESNARAEKAERERDAAVEQLRASKNTQWPTCWSAYY